MTLIYTAFAKLDAITRSVRVKNISDKKFKLDRIHSACVDFTGMDFEMLHLQVPLGERSARSSSAISSSVFRGYTRSAVPRATNNNPFVALARDGYTEESGEVYGLLARLLGQLCR